MIWETPNTTIDFTTYLSNALAIKKIRQSLLALNPDKTQYNRLKQELNELYYIQFHENWPNPDFGGSIQNNDSNQYVYKLKKILAVTGDLQFNEHRSVNLYKFDNLTDQAEIKYQHRHGLKPDGIVDMLTQAEYLFNKTERDFNHGCIRLERPFDLAASLYNDTEYNSHDTILQRIK